VTRRILTLDRSLVDHTVARLREGLAQALPLRPHAARTRHKPCPHCLRQVDATLSKCPHCLRLFRI
jgi:hypothetical protein